MKRRKRIITLIVLAIITLAWIAVKIGKNQPPNPAHVHNQTIVGY